MVNWARAVSIESREEKVRVPTRAQPLHLGTQGGSSLSKLASVDQIGSPNGAVMRFGTSPSPPSVFCQGKLYVHAMETELSQALEGERREERGRHLSSGYRVGVGLLLFVLCYMRREET